MSGHNKWSTIKHKKGAADAKRGKLYTKLIKEITVAARLGGGDPDGNPRLRRAIDAARVANMPGDNVTRAIKKGTGELEGVEYEELTYEGVGPAGTLFVIDVMTDNRNRTAPELRKLFDQHNCQLGSAGSALWAFDEKGTITLPKASVSEEKLFEAAVGAGADDVEDADDSWIVLTEKTAFDGVRSALEGEGFEIADSELAKIAKVKKPLDGDEAETAMNLFDALDDHDDVQKVWADFELTEQALQRLEP